MLSLLTGQVIQTQTIPLDSRLLYAFLGEVYIDTRADIDASTVDNIQVVKNDHIFFSSIMFSQLNSLVVTLAQI